MNKIEYDPFVLRQFKSEFKGTNLNRTDKEALLKHINIVYSESLIKLEDSQWDFCKYLIFKNTFNEIKSSVTKINLNIYPYIRSAYSSRTPDELPVLSRWVELPPGFELPIAEYIVIVLYSREQLLKEFMDKIPGSKEILQPDFIENKEKYFYLDNDVEYGIVSVMGTLLPEADPLVPITILRNALGTEEGGNGEKLDKELYKKSVEFWNTHILVK